MIDINIILKDVKANFVGTILPIISALICIPLYISTYGNNVSVIIFQLIAAQSFFMLLDFGISKSSIFFISKSIGQHKSKEAIKFTQDSIILSILISLFAFIILFSLLNSKYIYWGIFNNTNSIFLSLLLLLSILINTIRSIFEGWGMFRSSNIYRSISNSSIYISPLLTIFYSDEINVVHYILMSITISRSLILFFGIYFLIRNLNIEQFNINLNLNLLNFSIISSFSSLILGFLLYLDRFIVDDYFSKDDSVIYITIQEFMLRLLLISGSLSSVLFHHASKSFGKNGDIKIMIFYNAKVRFYLFAANLLCLFFLFILYAIVQFNKEYFPHFITNYIDIITVMLFGTSFLSFSLFSQTLLISTDKINSLLASHILQLILFLLLYKYFYKFGILGVSILWSLRAILDYSLNEFIIYCNTRNHIEK